MFHFRPLFCLQDLSYVNPGQSDEIDSKIVTERVLGFLVCLSKDEVKVLVFHFKFQLIISFNSSFILWTGAGYFLSPL